ncbi:MAG: class I SAM-dependent methyltransferase [Patescibacteria group bacterium]
MTQQRTWDREYKNLSLVSGSFEPTKDAKDFAHFLKKERGTLAGLQILDLGSGIGKNAHFFAERGAFVTGIEMSDTALAVARTRVKETDTHALYQKGNIGAPLPFPDNSFDAVLDVLSSNSLSEKERGIYLKETARVLKPCGYMLVKALSKDGDKNAKKLLKKFPGAEKDTCVLPETGITERIFSEADIRALYGKIFTVVSLKKTSHYPRVLGRIYKRNYAILVLQNSRA